MDLPVFTTLKAPERARIYVYPDGSHVTFINVTRVAVSKSGTHRLEADGNRKYIVPTGWRYIELDMDEWTF